MSNSEYYRNNSAYTRYLESQEHSEFSKYIDAIVSRGAKDSQGQSFLDVGCGTGIVLSELAHAGMRLVGVDISQPSIMVCKEKKLDCQIYDGTRLPFPDNSFDIVGSFNVLEHVDDPMEFLAEQKRVLKPKGFMILACPNFLAVSNGYHAHTKGASQKLRNIVEVGRRLTIRTQGFEKMPTIQRVDFQPDDDACNLTNPLDILEWAKHNGMNMEEWSSRSVYVNGFSRFIDIPLLRLFLGSCFFVLKKER